MAREALGALVVAFTPFIAIGVAMLVALIEEGIAFVAKKQPRA